MSQPATITGAGGVASPQRATALSAVLAAGLCLAILALYLPTVAAMVTTWMNSETFTHGFLIAPISLWLVWRDRSRLAGLPVAPCYPALVLVLGASLLWLLAHLVRVQVVQQLALVALLIAALWTLLGTALLRALAFPLGFLFLAVPMGKGLEPPMMDLTAEYTVRLIRLTGIPVYRENLFFMLPSGNWSVVEACSGVRYLIASFTLGVLFAYLSYRSPWRRLLFVLAAILVPIVANVIRAYGIVMIGHLSDMQLATGVDHLIYGWVFFGFVMLLLFWIGGFWQEPAEEQGTRRSKESELSPYAAAPPGQLVIATLLALLAAAAGPMAAAWSAAGTQAAGTPLPVPEAPAGWTVVDDVDMPWQPVATGAQRDVQVTYRRDAAVVTLWVKQYLQQSQGAELVDSLNRWAAADGNWRIVARERVGGAGGGAGVEQVALRHLDTGREFLGWFWYRVNDRESADPYATKMYEALVQLSPGEVLRARITLLTPVQDGDRQRAARHLRDFAGAQHAAIKAALSSGLVTAEAR